MYHRLTVHIYQPISNVFELSEGLSVTCMVSNRCKTYKIEPIRVPMRLDKLVDVPVFHPLRYHRE